MAKVAAGSPAAIFVSACAENLGRTNLRRRMSKDFGACSQMFFRVVLAAAFLAVTAAAQTPDDRYPFVRDGKLGFIDATGREAIAAQFQPIGDMSHFNDGLAPVSGPEGSGYIDPSGRFVIGPQKEWGSPRQFAEGIAAVLIWAQSRGSLNTPALIDRNGRIVLSGARVRESAYFSEGLMPMQENGRWGFVDHSFQWIIPPQFAHAGELSEGLAPVRMGSKEGFIDRQGKTIIPARYDDVWPFSNGAAMIRVNGLFGFVDRRGRDIISAQFDRATPFTEERAFVKTPGATHLCMINKEGRPITQPIYEWAGGFSDGLAAAQVNGIWGFIDHAGSWIIRPQFADTKGFWRGLARVSWDDGHGYIDKKGRIVWRTIH